MGWIPHSEHDNSMTTELGLQDMGTSRNASRFSTSSNSSGGTSKSSSTSSNSSGGTSKSGGISSNSSGGTSKSGGARALHHNRSSTEWHRGSGSQSGSTVESGLALFAGKRVLLVEVCDMVGSAFFVFLCLSVHVCLLPVCLSVSLFRCMVPAVCVCVDAWVPACLCLSVSVSVCACMRGVCWEDANNDAVCMLICQVGHSMAGLLCCSDCCRPPCFIKTAYRFLRHDV